MPSTDASEPVRPHIRRAILAGPLLPRDDGIHITPEIATAAFTAA